MIDRRIFEEEFILASRSTRRRELLERVGIRHRVIISGVKESTDPVSGPEALAVFNARAKALSVAEVREDITPVIGSDTIVTIDGDVLGKPKDDDDSRRMLERLSGRTHQVISGVCITDGHLMRQFSVTTSVTFRTLESDLIDRYIKGGEPRDKAGSYGIQGQGMLLVDHIAGDWANVVGLPVTRLCEVLTEYLAERDRLIGGLAQYPESALASLDDAQSDSLSGFDPDNTGSLIPVVDPFEDR